MEGDTVRAKSDPELQLTVRRYIDQVYYCKVQTDLKRKDLVYFERELIEDPELMAKNQQKIKAESKDQKH